jgi:hypothetical protein
MVWVGAEIAVVAQWRIARLMHRSLRTVPVRHLCDTRALYACPDCGEVYASLLSSDGAQAAPLDDGGDSHLGDIGLQASRTVVLRSIHLAIVAVKWPSSRLKTTRLCYESSIDPFYFTASSLPFDMPLPDLANFLPFDRFHHPIPSMSRDFSLVLLKDQSRNL